MKPENHFRDGPALAAILSASLGVFALGLFTVLAMASDTVKNFLTWYGPAGPLSGKSGMALVVWLMTWGLLHPLWKKREIKFAKIWRWALLLIALGFLLTFPPVFELFHSE